MNGSHQSKNTGGRNLQVLITELFLLIGVLLFHSLFSPFNFYFCKNKNMLLGAEHLSSRVIQILIVDIAWLSDLMQRNCCEFARVILKQHDSC